MRISIIKKGHFYKGLSKDSYNKGSWWLEIWNYNNVSGTLKKQSIFLKCGILKLWGFKVCTFKNLEFQNLKNVLPHIKWGKMYMR